MKKNIVVGVLLFVIASTLLLLRGGQSTGASTAALELVESHDHSQVDVVAETGASLRTQATVKVYFTNPSRDPAALRCTESYAVDRDVHKQQNLEQVALDQLLKGPTDAELEEGYATSIPPGIRVRSFTLTQGTALVTFSAGLEQAASTLCAISSLRSQITSTLLQFPDIHDVVISEEDQAGGK